MLKDETFIPPGSFAAGGVKSIVLDVFTPTSAYAQERTWRRVRLPWFELRTSFIEVGNSNHNNQLRSKYRASNNWSTVSSHSHLFANSGLTLIVHDAILMSCLGDSAILPWNRTTGCT